MAKSYNSVLDMVRDISKNPEYCDEVECYIANRNVSRTLSVLRCSKNLTQEEMAKEVGCSPEVIERLENSENEAIGIGDLILFAQIANMNISINFEENSTTVASVKRLAFQTERYLNVLVDLVEDDEAIGKNVGGFFQEYLLNTLYIFMEVKKRLEGQDLRKEDLRNLAQQGYYEVMKLASKTQTLLPKSKREGSFELRINTDLTSEDELLKAV